MTVRPLQSKKKTHNTKEFQQNKALVRIFTWVMFSTVATCDSRAKNCIYLSQVLPYSGKEAVSYFVFNMKTMKPKQHSTTVKNVGSILLFLERKKNPKQPKAFPRYLVRTSSLQRLMMQESSKRMGNQPRTQTRSPGATFMSSLVYSLSVYTNTVGNVKNNLDSFENSDL